jgi:hypothetical protein
MADEPEWARQPPPAPPPAAPAPAASPEPDWAKPAPAPSNEPAWARTPAPAPAPSLNERVGAAVVGAAIGAAKPPMDMSFLNLPKPILAMRFMNVLSCVEINQCVGCSVERRGTDIVTSSSRRRVDGVEDDAAIQHERAVKF